MPCATQATAPSDTIFMRNFLLSNSAPSFLTEATTEATPTAPTRSQMPPIANSAGTSIEALQAAITTITKLERRWRKSGRKSALYRYLATVFNLYAAWKHAGGARTAANRVAKLAGSSVEHDRHPLRILIDISSSADRKSKSRWTQALRFVWRERSKWKDLTECLRANGGIAGCAERWADLQAETRTPAGCVRIGGEDRVPRIPFFVGVELLDQYGDYKF